MWVTSKAGLQWNFRVYRYSPCSKKHLLQTKATSFHQCVPSAYLVAECTCNSKGSCCRAAVNRQYANMHMFWHPPTALHLPTLQLYVTNNYSWIDVFAWTLANCWLACGPGAPKPLAKQRKAGLKVSNDAKKEKRPKKYLGFSILLACGSFQRTCETSLQNLGRDRNFSRVHTPCIPDHRIPLREALEQGQKNHSWTSSSSVPFS